MISKQSFIETIVGKRIEEQRAYISAMRLVNRLLLKPFDKFIKPANPYTYLTICSIEELDRVEASLFSFVKNTSFHPEKYVIVSLTVGDQVRRWLPAPERSGGGAVMPGGPPGSCPHPQGPPVTSFTGNR